MEKTKDHRAKSGLRDPDSQDQAIVFVFEPPFESENSLPKAPAYLQAAVKWAIQDAGIANTMHKVQLTLPAADLSASKRDELRRRIRLVLELEKGNQKRRPNDFISVDLTPKKPRGINSVTLPKRIETAARELTKRDVPMEHHPMREDRSKKQPIARRSEADEEKTRGPDPLSILHELATPKPKPQDIVNLEIVLATAGKLPPEKKQKFVDDVNAVVDRANYCFRIEPDHVISKKLYLNPDSSRDGDIQFQLTKGGTRGFVRTKYELIPYTRPARE